MSIEIGNTTHGFSNFSFVVSIDCEFNFNSNVTNSGSTFGKNSLCCNCASNRSTKHPATRFALLIFAIVISPFAGAPSFPRYSFDFNASNSNKILL